MRRREFITLVGTAVAAWPLTAFGKTQRIAIVVPAVPVTVMSETADDPLFSALFKELRRLGYVEGQNFLVERYSGLGRASHYADLARDVVSRNPNVIIALTNNLVLDFKAATTTIPTVGVFGIPVETGIVASLARPGGNITGVSVSVGQEQWGKRIQLLQQVVPQATRLGFIQSRTAREQTPIMPTTTGVAWGGPPLDHPADQAEYRRVFAGLVQDSAAGIVVTDEEENIASRKLIVELAEENRLPAIYPLKLFVEAGGLMSYGPDASVYGYNVADIVGEILKGAKPGEIPIRQPTKFELVINLKTAKSLGLTVPATLLVAADEVIE
jgi:putative ABC transport system substrate-binding protein